MRLVKMIPLAALAALIGCQDQPTAPAQVDTPLFAKVQNEWIPFSYTLRNYCTDEYMDFVGKRKFLRTVTNDGAGGYHIRMHRNWQGTATGQVSGDTYNLNFNYNISEHAAPPFPYTYTRTHINNVSTRGGGPTQILRVTEHTTINANGEVTADVYHYTFECKGS